jgi:hypothetical protein
VDDAGDQLDTLISHPVVVTLLILHEIRDDAGMYQTFGGDGKVTPNEMLRVAEAPDTRAPADTVPDLYIVGSRFGIVNTPAVLTDRSAQFPEPSPFKLSVTPSDD